MHERPSRGRYFYGEILSPRADGKTSCFLARLRRRRGDTNVHLGDSMETHLKDGRGAEILVQIDAPHTHRIYREGERRAVTISEEAAKVLPVDAEPR